MSPKELSIIIVNYRSEQKIMNCLASIYNKFPLGTDFEIIIVNNHPGEKLIQIIGSYPGVKIIHLNQNRGFGAGVNRGVQEAQGEFLLFLNPDTEILLADFRQIKQLFSKDPFLGILGSRVVEANGHPEKWSAGQEITFWNLVKNNFGFGRWPGPKKEKDLHQAEWVSASALFIRTYMFMKLKGFDEKFFMYFEDMDLARRARDLGHKVCVSSCFSVRHWGGESYEAKCQQKKDYYDSLEYYFQKHRPEWEGILVRILRKLFYAR